MKFTVRNTTFAEVAIADLALTVAALTVHDLSTVRTDRLRASADLRALLAAGTLVCLKTVGPESYWAADEATAYLDTGLPPDPVFAGSGALRLPHGPSADAPAGEPGDIRYDTDLDAVVAHVAGDWQELLTDTDPRLTTQNVLRVKQNPGPGEFVSIQDALLTAHHDGASAEIPYVVEIAPGLYRENLTLVPHVALRGIGGVVIEPDDITLPLITACGGAAVSGVTLAGAMVAVRHAVAGPLLLDRVRFRENGGHVQVDHRDAVAVVRACGWGEAGHAGLTVAAGRLIVLDGHAAVRGESLGGMLAASGPDADLTVVGCVAAADGEAVGVVVRDGGRARLSAVSLHGFATAIRLEDGLAPPSLLGTGLLLSGNRWDLAVEHREATGGVQGIADPAKMTIAPASGFTVLVNDPAGTATTVVGPLAAGPAVDHVADVSDMARVGLPLGVTAGGTLAVGEGLSVAVAAGEGYQRTARGVARRAWADQTVAVPPNTAVYVAVDGRGDLIVTTERPDTTWAILLGRVVTDGSTVLALDPSPFAATHFPNAVDHFLRDAVGAVVATGCEVWPSPSMPLGIMVTPGDYYVAGIRHTVPGDVWAPFTAYHHRGGEWTHGPECTQVDADHYDDGHGLVPLPAGRFTKHAVYVVGERYFLVYGQAHYATRADAEAAPLPVPPPFFRDGFVPLAGLVVTPGSWKDAPSVCDARPMLNRRPGHGDLLGLTADHHPQYLRTDGTRPLAGDLDLGGHALTGVGSLDGVRVGEHAARHLPQGEDPLATAAPPAALTPLSGNAEGTANALARADHSHAITGFQTASKELSGLAGLNRTGVLVRKAAGQYETRFIAGTAGRVAVAGDSGITSDVQIDLAPSGVQPGVYNQVVVDRFGRVVEGHTVRDIPETTLTGDVVGSGVGTVATALSETGITPGGYRQVVVDAKGRVVGGSNPTTLADYGIEDAQPLHPALTAFAALEAAGLLARGPDGRYAPRSLVPPVAGLTIHDSDGVAGNPTFSLINDLAAVEGLTGTGFAVRTGDETWATRTLAGTPGRTAVHHGDGVADHPRVDLEPTGVTPGTYDTLTVDIYGRVVEGSNTAPVVRVPHTLLPGQFLDPDHADWAVAVPAAAGRDPAHPAVPVRTFQAGVEQGVGFFLAVPAGATLMRLRLRWRTDVPHDVALRLHHRPLPDAAPVPAWACDPLPVLPAEASPHYQTSVLTVDATALAGALCNFELTRSPAAAPGDWHLVALTVEFV